MEDLNQSATYTTVPVLQAGLDPTVKKNVTVEIPMTFVAVWMVVVDLDVPITGKARTVKPSTAYTETSTPSHRMEIKIRRVASF